MFHFKKIKSLIVLGLVAVLIVGGGGLITLGNISVNADANSLLGNAAKYNVFILGDVDATGSDIEGRLAAGGNVKLSAGYSVGHKLTAQETKEAYSLIAGGDLYYERGETVGDVVYGGKYSGSGGPRNGTGSLQQKPNVMDFATEFTLLRSKSQQLALLSANGTTTDNYGSFILVGTNANINIFNVNGNGLSSANGLSIDIPNGSTAIVNVSGSSVNMKSMGFSINGNGNKENSMNSKVLYNFSQATSLEIEGVGVMGSVFAPYASINFKNGQINGSVIGASFTGAGESHHISFSGQDPTTPTATPTPAVTPTPSPSPEPTVSPSASPSPEPTASPSASPSPEPSVSPSASPSPEPSPTPVPSASPEPSPTPVPSASPEPSPTTIPSASPEPSPTPVPSASPESSPTPVPSATPTAAPSATPTPTAAPSAEATPTPTAAPSATATPTVAPTAVSTPTIAPTTAPTTLPTAAPSATPPITVPTATSDIVPSVVIPVSTAPAVIGTIVTEPAVIDDDPVPLGPAASALPLQTAAAQPAVAAASPVPAPVAGPAPDEIVIDDEIPLGSADTDEAAAEAMLPQTGESSPAPYYIAGIAMAGLGLLLRRTARAHKRK